MRYVGVAFPKEMVEKTPKPKKGKTYYWRVKKPDEYDEDDERFTEDELRKMLDYYLKPIANSFRNSFIRFFIELINISMSFFIINIKSFAAMYNRTPVPLT